jgi:hypothetical protein
MAKREVDSDFPILHEQQTIFLWSSLESLIDDFLVAWLVNEPSAMQVEELKNIKITLAEYEALQGTERYHYLLSELERAVRSPFKKGCDRFETVLDVFGLSGEVPSDVKRDLLELQSARNVLLHRRGIIDRRFREVCPWVKDEVGTKLVVSSKKFALFFNAVVDYVSIVLKRVNALRLDTVSLQSEISEVLRLRIERCKVTARAGISSASTHLRGPFCWLRWRRGLRRRA